jgi:PAS domain S-box-containing protein
LEKFSFHTIKRAAIVISVFLSIGYVGLSQTLSGGKVNELDSNFSEVQVYSSAMPDVVLWLIGFGGLFCLGILIFRLIKSRQKFSQINRQNELFLQSTIESVIFCDLNGVITFCNDATVKMFGYNREEMIGRPISEFYALSGEFEMVNDALNYRNEFKGEIVNLRKNGDQFISQLSSNSIFNKNGVKTGTMGISRDITEKKESDDRFQHIIDNATDIIYTTNIQGEITYINTSAKSVLGYSNEDFLGMSFRKLIHPDDLEFVQNHYNEQFKSRAKETYLECRMVKANGQTIWIGQNVKTRFSHANPSLITGFFGILRNLDEIKRVQLSLAESELKYRELFDNSTDLIQSVDPNGQFLFVNPSWKKTLGYEDHEIKTLNFYDILHADSKEQCELLIEEILKLGDVADQSEHTFKMITKSKREVVLKGSLSVQFEAGQIIAIQSFFRDVTQQELIEAALVKSQENFKIISSSINDVFFLFDVVSGQYDYISSNCETVLSVDPEYFYAGKNFAKEFLTARGSNFDVRNA